MINDEFHRLTREVHILAMVMTKVAHQAREQRLNDQGVDISGMQYGILQMLRAHPFTISDLSRRFMVDPSTLVPMVDTLERKGLVERGRDPNDRRRWPLLATEEGKRLIARDLFAGEDDPVTQALRNLGVERSQQLLDLLRDVVRALPEGDAMLEEISARVCHATLGQATRNNSEAPGISESAAEKK